MRSLLAVALLGIVCWGAAPVAAQRTHTVQSGQSMSRIARRYHVNLWDLALANRMQPTAMLRPGQSLTVPSPNTTYVRAGQTLSHIAREHDCEVDELRRLNRIHGGLRVGRRIILPGYEAAESATPREWGTPEAPGVVQIRRRNGVMSLRLLDEERRVTREGLVALADLMRRNEDDAVELPHPRVALLLAAISDHFGGREIVLVSGRRGAGGYTRETSRHTQGRATDIRVTGVPRRQIWDYCRTLAHTGCGFYPRSTFVHVDVRAQAAQWVDWSRPGRRPRYGNLDRAWPRLCRDHRRRGHRLCRAEGRRVSAPQDAPREFVLTDEARGLFPEIPPDEPDEAPEVDEYETASDEDPDLDDQGAIEVEDPDLES